MKLYATMNTKTVLKAKTADEARQYAISWQMWFSDNSLSYGELVEWQDVFYKLAVKFDLIAEFKENGII